MGPSLFGASETGLGTISIFIDQSWSSKPSAKKQKRERRKTQHAREKAKQEVLIPHTVLRFLRAGNESNEHSLTLVFLELTLVPSFDRI